MVLWGTSSRPSERVSSPKATRGQMMGRWDLRGGSGRGMLLLTEDIWMLACSMRERGQRLGCADRGQSAR